MGKNASGVGGGNYPQKLVCKKCKAETITGAGVPARAMRCQSCGGRVEAKPLYTGRRWF